MMKKTILLLVAALCGVLTAAAQDLIVKTDATKVEAKVTEITPDAVRYKRFSIPTDRPMCCLSPISTTFSMPTAKRSASGLPKPCLRCR